MNKVKFCEKSKIIFFSDFFPLNVNSAFPGIGYLKKYVNLTKIFLFKQFQELVNQTECSMFDIKSLVAEICKLY